jgi:hypothetical protein
LQGADTCTACSSGYFSGLPGSTECVPAASGNVTMANTQRWSPDCHPTDTACIDSSAYKVTLGSTVETFCEAGTYSLGSASQCTKCGLGTYSAAVGAISSATCEKCVPGSFANQLG